MSMHVISPLTHNGREYRVGDTIDLSPAEAAAMPWAVEAAAEGGQASVGAAMDTREPRGDAIAAPVADDVADQTVDNALATIDAIADLDALAAADDAELAREDGGRPAVRAAIDARCERLAGQGDATRETSAQDGDPAVEAREGDPAEDATDDA